MRPFKCLARQRRQFLITTLYFLIFDRSLHSSGSLEISKSCSEGDVITLSGPLGVGKTTFAKFIIRYLVNEYIEVTSPTYNIIQSYRSFDDTEILHMDFYRLNNKINIYDLDIIESFEKSISIIEWPEKLIEIIPEKRLDIKFNFVDNDDNLREIILIN